ncbi:hypothetical protein ACJ72_06519 [Emergomyces africanus]|uniref:CSN8/PSMD8/EIF3K domain-containing protein n=1 Tax=Emergomyces africanus TaxID=1955775 RepID=A0A1B7NQQ8_9EURO|nr:hypothetical protein ACJ72_06519 [Emergomyces africanus]
MVSLADLAHVLATAQSSTVLLQKLMELEGDVSLTFGDTHMASDTEFLSTYYSAYIIALLLENEINEAQMLTRRLPESLVNGDPTIQSTISLLRAVWNQNHAKIYDIIRTTRWPPTINHLVQQYQRKDKTQPTYLMLLLLTIAYSLLPKQNFSRYQPCLRIDRPSTAALYLGLDSVRENTMRDSEDGPCSELVAILTEKGWEWNAELNLFSPKVTTHVPKAFVSGGAAIAQSAAQLRSHEDESLRISPALLSSASMVVYVSAPATAHVPSTADFDDWDMAQER